MSDLLFAISPLPPGPKVSDIMGHMGGVVGDDALLFVEIRDETTGYLIGSAYAAHSWDGKNHVDGWVEDPWLAAAEAVAEARACLAAPSRQEFYRQRLEAREAVRP